MEPLTLNLNPKPYRGARCRGTCVVGLRAFFEGSSVEDSAPTLGL